MTVDLRTYIFLDSLQLAALRASWGPWPRASCPCPTTPRCGSRSRPGSRSTASPTSPSSRPACGPGCRSSSGCSACSKSITRTRPRCGPPGRPSCGRSSSQESDRIKPKVVSSQIIRHIDAHQVQLINRMRHGHMLLAGQTLYVLEVEPAGYAALAANEAEKAARHQHPGGDGLRQLRARLPGGRGTRHHGRLRRGRGAPSKGCPGATVEGGRRD